MESGRGVPIRLRPTLLLAAVAGVSLAHYLTPVGGHATHAYHAQHALYRWCYHLPIILGAFWFGLRGGALTALVVTLLYLPHLGFQWGGGSAEQWFEIALYNVVGWVTGFLSDRQGRERDRHREAAKELDLAYAELRDRTRVLLETEQELRQAERLSALGELSAGLAHEVKTPLASIRGAVEILGDRSLDGEERAEFTEILDRETERLNQVVSRFLELARPRGSPAAEADVPSAVREVLDLVRAECERAGIRTRADLPGGLPAARIDPGQLRQVVLNLVVNAIQAMEGGGTVELRAEPSGGFVRLTVADSGAGIPESLRTRIFIPFVTGRPGGTGLGLSIVQRILENHGGSIEARSRGEGGTEFVVMLPGEEPSHGFRQADPARGR